MKPKINYLAVLVSGLFYWILGAVWYSPLLFGNKFIALMKWTPQELAVIAQQSAAWQLVVALLGSLLLAYILAHFVKYTQANTALEGVVTALWLWLGFVVVTNLNTVLFEFRPVGLYLINLSYHLVAMAAMGALLAVWQKPKA